MTREGPSYLGTYNRFRLNDNSKPATQIYSFRNSFPAPSYVLLSKIAPTQFLRSVLSIGSVINAFACNWHIGNYQTDLIWLELERERESGREGKKEVDKYQVPQ